MNIELATIQEYESIIAFYDDVTARTPEIATYARWQKGKHPTAEGIRAYIDEGSMYLYKENGKIVGAMAVRLDALASNNQPINSASVSASSIAASSISTQRIPVGPTSFFSTTLW